MKGCIICCVPAQILYLGKILFLMCTLFYKQLFYKQRLTEIGKKVNEMLSNICYLKIIFIHVIIQYLYKTF